MDDEELIDDIIRDSRCFNSSAKLLHAFAKVSSIKSLFSSSGRAKFLSRKDLVRCLQKGVSISTVLGISQLVAANPSRSTEHATHVAVRTTWCITALRGSLYPIMNL